MELLTYIGSSLLFALFFFRGLHRYDGPRIPDHVIQDLDSGPVSFFEREEMMRVLGMRRMLTGSLFRAGWLIICWGSVGVLFFMGDQPLGIFPAVLFAFPWGFGLAVAYYNIRKWLALR